MAGDGQVISKNKKPEKIFSGFFERLAATYSRRTYRTTTIGKTAFDGRVRNGIGSDHSFMATKNYCKEQPPKRIRRFIENCTQDYRALQFAS